VSTNASKAATDLSAAFDFNEPIRWSIAQLYQSVLDGEAHVKDIVFQTTLAGYIHFLLTGKRVLGLDDASGMFPVDPATKAYDTRMVSIFKEKTGIDVTAIFPEPLPAGADAGVLTAEGAKLLDPSGTLNGIHCVRPKGTAARHGGVDRGASWHGTCPSARALSR
jgi:sugar (pentulose or hexulose) kinase